MITFDKKALNERWHRWVLRRNQPGTPQKMNDKNLYILPSAFGWLFALVLLTLLIGSVNYQISTGFLLTFFLALLALLSAWDGHRNIKDLTIDCLPITDVTAGQPVKVILKFRPASSARYEITVQFGKNYPCLISKLENEELRLELPLTTNKRGVYQLPPLLLKSYHPYGLFRVWGYAHFDLNYYVYPLAVSPGFWPLALSQDERLPELNPGEEEYYELKQVDNPWSARNRIAWKIAARGQGWFLKSMSNNQSTYWVFNMKELRHLSTEKALEGLCFWLTSAEQQGHYYALELEDLQTEMDKGEAHLQFCLRQLAQYS